MSSPMAAAPRSWSRWTARTSAVAALLAVAAALGVLSASQTSLAVIGAILLLLVGVGALDLGYLVVLAAPATLVMVRAGGFLSISDVVLAGATVVALVLARAAEMLTLQPLIWAGIVYGATLIPTLVLNQYAANTVEWAHELVLVIGSLVVGWVIGRRGQARGAIGLYVAGCAGIAIAAIIAGLLSLGSTGKFGPVYLPYLHKNLIGDSIAVAIVIAYARPRWLGWGWRLTLPLMLLFATGLAASGARQAIISAVVGLAVVNLRGRVSDMRRSRLIWVALIPAAVMVVRTVSTQLHSGNEFNSTSQRLTWFGDSIHIWQHSPLFGVGLRWWYTPRFGMSFQPPNAEFEMLTSAGIVGVAGFLTLFTVATWNLAKLDPAYGTVALAVVTVRFAQGQLDLYWVAGTSSLLWIIAGIVHGLAYRDAERRSDPVLPPPEPALVGLLPRRLPR